jgi:hypothetical protein
MPLTRLDRDNVGDCKGQIAVIPYDVEILAFDSLGPLVRAALNDSPVKILAFPIVQELLGLGLNPCDPRIDAMAAHNLRVGARNVLLKDRSMEDAQLGMRPLRARFKAKRSG